MAPQKLTEYERRRLENIKRNEEMLAALKVHSKLSQLSAATKSLRPQTKSFKVSNEKKQAMEAPIVLRRSLRTRGAPPDASTAGGLKDNFDETQKSISRKSPASDSESTFKKRAYELGPISMRDAHRTEGSDWKLIETILECSRKSKKRTTNVGICDSTNRKEENDDLDSSEVGRKISSSIDIDKLILFPENIARVVQGKTPTIKFLPTACKRVVVVGNKFGDVGFWNVEAEDDDENGIYVYHPHSAPVSGIVFDSFTLSKMFTTSYDGFIRLMDVERELFDLVYFSDEAIFSLSTRPYDAKSLYFGKGSGEVSIWDLRTGKASSSWNLHQDRINTIDFNLQNPSIMATSSTDGTVCIWDLRSIRSNRPRSLKAISHERAVHSAYFSPSGRFLASTSVDDKIGLLSGKNYEEISRIYHNNRTSRWISSFRGIWGWDDSCIFIGDMRRGVNVISTAEKKVTMTLESEYVTAIPCRFDAHQYEIGMLAGATSGGQVYIWKPS